MSWLRTSPLRQSFSRSSRARTLENNVDFDLKACYDSFCKHWQQVHDIILRVTPNKPSSHDDVLGVVNHLDHMVTLLLVELQNCNKLQLPSVHTPSSIAATAPCQEFLLSENLLDKLYEWGRSTGRYSNAVLLEQLKLYELLVSHSRHQLLVHEPFLRPLLKILASCEGEIFSHDIEKRLVILLNQLCVVLMQNVPLLDLFFFSSSQQQQQQQQQQNVGKASGGTNNFIIFSLLLPYVHREGSLGHQARDALLLCMSLSQKNSNVGTYIARHTSMCAVLVTGLGGLYSLLPSTVDIATADWHRITPDDVAEIGELAVFMNALEFCNAVVQVAHELIREQLLDVMYHGFIIPVLGPTLLQNNAESQISAMAYLDLILRSVTEPGLLQIFVRFLLDADKFDGQRILDVLVDRINSVDTRLCMVTLSLFDTLLALHCEDLMLELLLKFLVPCKHIPISHRHKVNRTDTYPAVVGYFLELAPEVLKQEQQQQCDDPVPSQQRQTFSKTIGANWNHYGLHTGDSLYSNYRAYLFDARHKISQCQRACSAWSSPYRLQATVTAASSRRNEKAMELIRSFLNEFGDGGGVAGGGGGEKPISAVSVAAVKQLDSLQSLGESSSGYESFRYRVEDAASDDSSEDRTADGSTVSSNVSRRNESWRTSSRQQECELEFDFSEDLFTQGTVTLGPFLSSIWGKLQTFTSNCVYVNLHLTGLITRLAWYPLPLIHSILLRPDIPTTSDTPSFHQLLRILKQQIDAELPVNEESLELVDVGRFDLVEREFRLVNTRKNAVEGMTKSPARNGFASYTSTTTTTNNNGNHSSFSQTSMANVSATTPPQLTASSSYDPFRRGESKRKSLTSSLSSIFKRPSSSNQNSSGASPTVGSTIQMREQSPSTGSDSQQPSSLDHMGSTGGSGTTKERTRDLALCAVILDEWLKELSAIAQEHSIVMLGGGGGGGTVRARAANNNGCWFQPADSKSI